MFGQVGHFFHFAKEQVPYAMKRFADESTRLMRVMDNQLAKNTYISGVDYTIADMAIWPWVWCYQFIYQQNIDTAQFPHLLAWYQKIAQRPAVKATLKAYGRD